MEIKTLDDLLNTLEGIGFLKSTLPFELRGWVNVLGLHVQLSEAGGLSRLQAGGAYRSYLDAWRGEEGKWDVKKFDEKTWDHRFAAVVVPTYEIADFLLNCEGAKRRFPEYEDLHKYNASLLPKVIEHYKSTGEWLGLPAHYKQGDQKFREHLNPELEAVNEAAIHEVRRRLGLDEETDKKIQRDEG